MSDIQDQAVYSRRNMLFNLQQLMALGQRFEPRGAAGRQDQQAGTDAAQ